MSRPASPARPPRTAGYRRIVVAVGSDGGGPAMDLAQALAGPDAVFILARVHHATHHGEFSARVDADLGSAADALRVLREARELLGQECEIVAHPGATAVVGLHRIAEQERADLLVVGSHQPLTGAHSALPAVLRGSPCPVAIAAAPHATDVSAKALRKVGFAFEDTQPGRHAAYVAAKLARTRNAELHGVSVISVAPGLWTSPVAAGLHTLQRLEGTLADVARQTMTATVPSATTHVLEGDPVDLLAEFAGTVDLLVVGSRGAGPLCRLASGSTAEALSVRCPFALLVTAGNDVDPS